MQGREDKNSNSVKGSNHATLSFSVEGPYLPFTKFRKAIDSFIDLLTEIDRGTSDNGDLTVEWSISSVRTGSIHITAVANPVSQEVHQLRPKRVIETVAQGIDQLHDSPVIPVGFSDAALKHVKTFGDLIDPDDFAEIRFESNGWATEIAPRLSGNVDEITKTTQRFYGSVEGILVSISLSGKQSLGIRSSLEGKTIRCYFKDETLEKAKEALGCRVYAFGLIRQRTHGPKINIQVDELKILPSAEQVPTVSELLAKIRGGE